MDAIKKPAHYNQGPIECIDAMKIVLTPEEFRGYLKGNVFKYLWREKDKNGIEDLRKAKWYLDRLIQSFDESEQKQPAWTPKVGDWVRIKKPSSDKRDSVLWSSFMDEHDKEVVQVKEIEDGAMVHGEWFFPFDWLKPAEAPKEQPQPPDGWRWLELGEVIRKGDRYFKDHKWYDHDLWFEAEITPRHRPSIRRNKFEVGEKVIDCRTREVFSVQHTDNQHSVVFVFGASNGIESKHLAPLAPYIEEQS